MVPNVVNGNEFTTSTEGAYGGRREHRVNMYPASSRHAIEREFE